MVITLTMDAKNSISSLFTSCTVLLPENQTKSLIRCSYAQKSLLCLGYTAVTIIFTDLIIKPLLQPPKHNIKFLACFCPFVIKHFFIFSFVIQILWCHHLWAQKYENTLLNELPAKTSSLPRWNLNSADVHYIFIITKRAMLWEVGDTTVLSQFPRAVVWQCILYVANSSKKPVDNVSVK